MADTKEVAKLCDEIESLIVTVRRVAEARTYDWPNDLAEFGEMLPSTEPREMTQEIRRTRQLLEALPGVRNDD